MRVARRGRGRGREGEGQERGKGGEGEERREDFSSQYLQLVYPSCV